MPKKEKDKDVLNVSPAKSLVDELDLLEVLLKQITETYLTRVTGELQKVRSHVYNLALQEEIPTEKIKDIREMLTILRVLQTHPEKGRRKDLKKVDDIIDDLQHFIEAW